MKNHLSTRESGDVCKNSIKQGEAMIIVMCIRIRDELRYQLRRISNSGDVYKNSIVQKLTYDI